MDEPISSSPPPTDPTLLIHHFHANLNFNEKQDKDKYGEVDNENFRDHVNNKETAHEENGDGWRCHDDADAGGRKSSSYKMGEDDIMHYPQQLQYPLRPGAEDCNFYMRMGTCKFGFTCKFNHPPRTTANQPLNLKPRMKEREDHSEMPIQTECKVFYNLAKS